MRPIYLTKFVLLTSIVAAFSAGLFAQSVTFSTAGGPFTYTVPLGVTAVGITANGAQGGNGTGGNGGKGGQVVCQLAVTGGEVLHLYVGGQGSPSSYASSVAGGVNGGGNGWSDGGGGGGDS